MFAQAADGRVARVDRARRGNQATMATRRRTTSMRRTRILGADRRTPGADLGPERSTLPPVAQTGALRSGAARRHLSQLSSRDRAQPAGTGGGVVFLALLMILAVIAVLALAATGNL
jgi:hypothetical protein